MSISKEDNIINAFKELKGIPPSKKKIEWNEMIVTRFSDEKIVEEWIVSELMGALLLKALGVGTTESTR